MADWEHIIIFVVLYAVVAMVILRMHKPEGAGGWIIALAGALIVVLLLYYLWNHTFVAYDKTGQTEPWLIQGTKQANVTTLVPANKIPRATDGQFGVEFSYGFWMFVSQWSDQSQWKDGLHHVLHKGDDQAAIQAPGIWLAPKTNRLIVKMNTYNTSAPLERCSVGNIPMKKWVHVSVVVINRYLDIYINGHLKKRCILRGLPQQNFGNVYVNARGGFEGFMSQVRYFAYALPLWKIDQLVADGPSDAPCTQPGETPPYLAADYWQTNRYPRS
jgi:hypothetical protein